MDLVLKWKQRFSDFKGLGPATAALVNASPPRDILMSEAFCCRALLRCWSLPIPRNWNTRSAWLKSRTRAAELGDSPGFLWRRSISPFLNGFPIFHATLPELASGSQPSPELEDTGGQETHPREVLRELHHLIIWKAMESHVSCKRP